MHATDARQAPLPQGLSSLRATIKSWCSPSSAAMMARMTSAREQFLEHTVRAQGYLSLKLSEADTRAHLVDPVLSILGYRGVTDVRREVPVPATGESLDYELLAGGQPQAIVEAKALKRAITDQHAAQCVQYASVLGVRWCIITNGIEWAFYDAHAKGPLAEKKVKQVRLDGDETATTEAWSVLSLFSLESISKPAPLTQLLIERVVVDELERPDSPTIGALRRAVKDRFGEHVSGQAVLDVVRRRMAAPETPPVVGLQPVEGDTSTARPAPSGNPAKRLPSSGISRLVEAGILPADAVLECRLYGVTHTASVRDGQIELDGVLYATPSAAASALRDGKATNGWIVWRHKGELLADLRAKLPTHSSTPAAPGAA